MFARIAVSVLAACLQLGMVLQRSRMLLHYQLHATHWCRRKQKTIAGMEVCKILRAVVSSQAQPTFHLVDKTTKQLGACIKLIANAKKSTPSARKVGLCKTEMPAQSRP